ncbi:MAG TPA: V-type ATP synthase subunit E family protein [Candidatus Bathyarchaeia archaeon]|nr:V-type ATP synthase subunit E family protein [Candidatus Bathyarchaeia archaeon]
MSETRKFTEDILATANAKSQTIITKAENERQQLLDEARKNINRETAEITRNAEADAEGVKRREISEVRHRVKLREELEKDKVLTDVLNETKKKVHEIVNDKNKYSAYLVRLVTDSIRQLGMQSVRVHLNAEDLKNIDITALVREVTSAVKTPTKIEVARDLVTTSGGVVVSSPDDKIRIVNTFEQRFEALEPKLLIEAGRLLFGEHT